MEERELLCGFRNICKKEENLIEFKVEYLLDRRTDYVLTVDNQFNICEDFGEKLLLMA